MLDKNKEYITLDEALKATGLSEKTLRDHMRVSVTPIGRNAWDRLEFFEYWRKRHYDKQKENRNRVRIAHEVIQDIFDKRQRR